MSLGDLMQTKRVATGTSGPAIESGQCWPDNMSNPLIDITGPDRQRPGRWMALVRSADVSVSFDETTTAITTTCLIDQRSTNRHRASAQTGPLHPASVTVRTPTSLTVVPPVHPLWCVGLFVPRPRTACDAPQRSPSMVPGSCPGVRCPDHPPERDTVSLYRARSRAALKTIRQYRHVRLASRRRDRRTSIRTASFHAR